jgi:hypothetical protein
MLHVFCAKDMQHINTSSITQLLKTIQNTNLNNLILTNFSPKHKSMSLLQHLNVSLNVQAFRATFSSFEIFCQKVNCKFLKWRESRGLQ